MHYLSGSNKGIEAGSVRFAVVFILTTCPSKYSSKAHAEQGSANRKLQSVK